MPALQGRTPARRSAAWRDDALHFSTDAPPRYHMTGAVSGCGSRLGTTSRMRTFADALTGTLRASCASLDAWCLLPDQWHALVLSLDLRATMLALDRLHAHTGTAWRMHDGARGRVGWIVCTNQRIRDDTHFRAAMNTIRLLPVHQGLAQPGQNWPYGSAHERF